MCVELIIRNNEVCTLWCSLGDETDLSDSKSKMSKKSIYLRSSLVKRVRNELIQDSVRLSQWPALATIYFTLRFECQNIESVKLKSISLNLKSLHTDT